MTLQERHYEMKPATKLFLGGLGLLMFCALVFEDCANPMSAEPSVEAEAVSKPVEAERSEAATTPLLVARSELEKVTEERDELQRRLDRYGSINAPIIYEPGDEAAAQPLYLEAK